MKKSIVFFGFIFILTSMWVTLDSKNQALAVSGCCKTRASQNDPWKKFGTNLESCKAQNKSDGDNLFKKSGVVWWDTAC